MSRFTRAVACLVTCSAFVLNAADPAWYNEPQFFDTYSFYTYNADPLLRQIPFTGQAWGSGFSYPIPAIEISGTKTEIAAWNGKPFFAYLALDVEFTPPAGNLLAEWDLFRQRTLSGSYINFNGGDADSATPNSPTYSLSSPVYQASLTARVQAAVDVGASGIMIDSIADPLASIVYADAAHGGSFDTVTMAAFAAHLQNTYSPAQLQSTFGLASAANFNLGAYIQTKGLAATWNQKPFSDPLVVEFYNFKLQETLTFLRTLVSTTKQYARQKYNRDFLFSCNAAFNPASIFARDVMDLTTQESSYIGGSQGPGEDHPFMATDIRAWKGWKGPVLLSPEVYSQAQPNPVQTPTVNLMRVIIADSQAGGGIVAPTTKINADIGAAEPVDTSVVRRYANFILSNPQLMSQTTTPSRIALLESSSSIFNTMFPSPAEKNVWRGSPEYSGIARILLDSGLTYDSVFLPDTSYSTLASPSVQDLARYSVVIAPYLWALDENQVNAILGYVQQGGTLIVEGSFGNSQPTGQQANRPQLSAIPKSGAVAYGSGTIVVSPEMHGVEYQQIGIANISIDAQQQARASFNTLVVPYIQPDVVVSGVTPVIHVPGVTPFLYRDRNGNALVHLVNYDYDLPTDHFYTKTNVQVSVNVGSQPVDDVILRSPDMTGAQSLPFTRNGNIITLTVPQVDAWDVLYFQQNKQAPVIVSATPGATLAAIGGNSFSFNVQASDADGNPLTYTWTVNGQAVTETFGPAYTLQLPSTASGLYTVTVAVTDGSRVTQTSWSINVSAYKSPRVLFDDSHAEEVTIDPDTASRISQGNPVSWFLMGTLKQAMQPNYQVSRLGAGPITAQTLSNVDVLVLGAPQNALSVPEVQAIKAFVEGGGGLMFLGEAYSEMNSINSLLAPWGVQFSNTRIESPNFTSLGCANPTCFNITTFINHPALPANPSFLFENGGSLTVSQGGTSLAQTIPTAWKSNSGQNTQQSGDPNGVYSVLAAAQPGKGRVYISGSSAFPDAVLNCGCDAGNLDLILSAFAWLTAGVNPPPSLPAASTATISSVVNGASFGPVISPGSWVTITGKNLANTGPAGQVWSGGDFNGNLLPTVLKGTSVWINGRAASVEFISPGQVNVQAPDDSYQGPVAVQVLSPSGLVSGSANLKAAAPALFPISVSGTNYAAAVGLDGSLIAPPSQIPGARAAKPGEIVQLYGTGFGETSPHQPAGQLINGAPLAATVTATICNQEAAVKYGGLISPGLDQINLEIPAVSTGNCPIILSVAGVSTQAGVVIPIGQ